MTDTVQLIDQSSSALGMWIAWILAGVFVAFAVLLAIWVDRKVKLDPKPRYEWRCTRCDRWVVLYEMNGFEEAMHADDCSELCKHSDIYAA